MPYLNDPNTIPQGGWQYPHPAGGSITGYNYHLFFEKVRETYRANAAEPPSDDMIITWMCKNLYIQCNEGNQPFINLWTAGLPPKPQTSCCG